MSGSLERVVRDSLELGTELSRDLSESWVEERVRIREIEIYLGHVVNLDDFGAKLYYLTCKIRGFTLVVGWSLLRAVGVVTVGKRPTRDQNSAENVDGSLR